MNTQGILVFFLSSIDFKILHIFPCVSYQVLFISSFICMFSSRIIFHPVWRNTLKISVCTILQLDYQWIFLIVFKWGNHYFVFLFSFSLLEIEKTRQKIENTMDYHKANIFVTISKVKNAPLPATQNFLPCAPPNQSTQFSKDNDTCVHACTFIVLPSKCVPFDIII